MSKYHETFFGVLAPIPTYHDATVEGHKRVLVIVPVFGAESSTVEQIEPPADLDAWKVYNKFATSDATYYTLSKDGD